MGSPLGRYPSEVGGIASELSYLLDDLDLREDAEALVKERGNGILRMTRDEYEKALGFLQKTMGQRDKFVAKKDDETVILLILRARYLGILSSKMLYAADDLAYIPGSSYRSAAGRGAEKAISLLTTLPDIQDVLSSSGY